MSFINAPILSVALLLGASSLQGAELSISVEPPIASISAGEPVEVHLVITNHDSVPRQFVALQTLELDLEMRRTLATGLSENSKGPTWARNRAETLTAASDVVLAPGESYRQPLILSEWFDFDQVGSETVTISWPAENSAAEIQVAVSPHDEARLKRRANELLNEAKGNYPRNLVAERTLRSMHDPVLVRFWQEVANDRRAYGLGRLSSTAIAALESTETSAAVSVLAGLAVSEQNDESPRLAGEALSRIRALSKHADLREAAARALGH